MTDLYRAELASEKLEATGEWMRIDQNDFVADDDHIYFDPIDMDFRYATTRLPRTEEDIRKNRETSLTFICMKYIGTNLRKHPTEEVKHLSAD